MHNYLLTHLFIFCFVRPCLLKLVKRESLIGCRKILMKMAIVNWESSTSFSFNLFFWLFCWVFLVVDFRSFYCLSYYCVFFPSMDLRIWEIDKFVIRKVGCVWCLSYLGFEIVGSSRYQGQEIFQFKFTVLFVNNIITRNRFLWESLRLVSQFFKYQNLW